jgi:hypothetical protein
VNDWRYTAIVLLIQHDPDQAAESLSRLLLKRPSKQLIDMTEGLFVKHRRYETVPIYMRYALIESIHPSPVALVGQDRYKIALDELGIPQVAKAWLITAAYSQVLFEAVKAREQSRPMNLRDDDFMVSMPLSERLTRLLNLDADAGRRVVDWQAVYATNVQKAPSPLNDSQRKETDRVLACFGEYETARSEWFRAINETDGMRPPEPVEPDCPDNRSVGARS